MHALCRKVRFSANGDGASALQPANAYAGFPRASGFSRHFELEVRCAGEPDPATGYLVDIRAIDRAVRDRAPAILARAMETPAADPASALPELFSAIASSLATAPAAIALHLTPTLSLTLERADMTSVLLCQRFEFSASHRLHAPSLTDAENRRIFGKCNNPSGHGHNYWFEPVVRLPLRSGAPTATLADIERAALETIIERFDHKHLNADCPEFADINPSVERIAQVCFDLLAPEIRALGQGVDLVLVRVWETEKTRCEYPTDAS